MGKGPRLALIIRTFAMRGERKRVKYNLKGGDYGKEATDRVRSEF